MHCENAFNFHVLLISIYSATTSVPVPLVCDTMRNLLLMGLMLLFPSEPHCGATANDQPRRHHPTTSTGMEFVFTLLPMHEYHLHINDTRVRMLTVLNTNPSDVNVTLEALIDDKLTETRRFIVPAKNYRDTFLTEWLVQSKYSLNGGIRMTSTLPVSAHVFEGIDVFRLLSVDHLGTKYLLSTPGCTYLENQRQYHHAMVVATEDDTTVNVSFALSDEIFPPVHLNRLQRLSIWSGISVNVHMSGALVTASRPVAIITGQACRTTRLKNSESCNDKPPSVCRFEAEMMLPVNSLGDTYFLVPFFHDHEDVTTYIEVTMPVGTHITNKPAPDILQAIPAQSINNVKSNCSWSHSGYCVQYFKLNNATFLKFSVPVMITQFGRARFEYLSPPLVLVPPITAFDAQPVGYVGVPPVKYVLDHQFTGDFLLILAYPNYLEGLLLDGVPIKTTWKTVSQPGVTIAFTFMTMKGGYHALHNANPHKPTHFLAIAYGYHVFVSYAFVLSVNPTDYKQQYCIKNTETGVCIPADATCTTGWQSVIELPTNPEPNCTRSETKKRCEVKAEDCPTITTTTATSTAQLSTRRQLSGATATTASIEQPAMSPVASENSTDEGEKRKEQPGQTSTQAITRPVRANATGYDKYSQGQDMWNLLVPALGSLCLVTVLLVLLFVIYRRRKQTGVGHIKSKHPIAACTTTPRGQYCTDPGWWELRNASQNSEDKSQKNVSQQMTDREQKSQAHQTSQQGPRKARPHKCSKTIAPQELRISSPKVLPSKGKVVEGRVQLKKDVHFDKHGLERERKGTNQHLRLARADRGPRRVDSPTPARRHEKRH